MISKTPKVSIKAVNKRNTCISFLGSIVGCRKTFSLIPPNTKRNKYHQSLINVMIFRVVCNMEENQKIYENRKSIY